MMINGAFATQPLPAARDEDPGKIDTDRPGVGVATPLPGAGATPMPEIVPVPPELPSEQDLEDHRQRFEEVLGIDFKMRFRLAQRGEGDDTRIGFKFKMKAHSRVDDFSVKMKQQIRGHVRMNGEQEDAVNRLDARFKLDVKIKIEASGQGQDGAEQVGQLVDSFAAIFQGFLDGIAGVLGGRPASPAPGEQIAAPVDPSAPVDAAAPAVTPAVEPPSEEPVVAMPATEESAVVAPVVEETLPQEPAVVAGPAEATSTSPLADLFHRLAEMFRDLSQDLVGILGARAEGDQGDEGDSKPVQRPESFRLQASFHAHIAYQQAVEPGAESRLIAEA